jgi:hypothetical protein
MVEWGAMIDQANPAETIKKSAETTKDLQESLTKMVTTTQEVVKLVGDAEAKMQKEKTGFQKKTGFFSFITDN